MLASPPGRLALLLAAAVAARLIFRLGSRLLTSLLGCLSLARSTDGDEAAAAGSAPLPGVFRAPIRPDVVHFVHSRIALNKRQPYCVNKCVAFPHPAARRRLGG